MLDCIRILIHNKEAVNLKKDPYRLKMGHFFIEQFQKLIRI